MAEATLSGVIDQMRINGERNNELLTSLNSSVNKLNGMMGSFLKQMQMQRMDMLEALREQKDGAKKETAAAPGKPKGGSNIAMILAGIAAIAAGFLTGIKDSVKALAKLARLDKVFDAIRGALRTLGSGLRTRFVGFVDDAIRIADDLIKPLKTFFTAEGGAGRFLTGLRNTFRSTFTGAASIVDDLIQPFKAMFSVEGPAGSRITKLFNSIVDIFKFPFEGIIDDVAKPFKNIFMAGDGPPMLTRIIDTITRPFKAAVTFVTDLIKPITTFFSAEGPIAKAFGVIKQAFSIFQEGSQLMKMLNGIGRVIGRLFFPITLIMTAYDTIKGALAGFEDEGIIGAIQGAITGLLNSVIGMPLDLLKDIVSWLLSKFGMDEASKALDSFSFTDLISGLIDGLFDGLKMVINGIIEGLATVIENLPLVPDSVGDTIRGLKFDTKVQERKKLDEEIEATEEKTAALRKKESIDKRMLSSMERKAMEDGKITRSEQRAIDRQKNKLEKSSGARQENVDELERLRSERAALEPAGGGGSVNVDASQNGSSETTMITPTTRAQSATDPMGNPSGNLHPRQAAMAKYRAGE